MSKDYQKHNLAQWRVEQLVALADICEVEKTVYTYNGIIDRNKLVQLLVELRKQGKYTEEQRDVAYTQPDPDPVVGKIIVISNVDRPGGNTPVYVGLNDKDYNFPRERELFVPFEILEILENARETVLEVIDTGLPTGPERRTRTVRRIPFTIVRDVTRSELEANR
jgi:hypothetical protein